MSYIMQVGIATFFAGRKWFCQPAFFGHNPADIYMVEELKDSPIKKPIGDENPHKSQQFMRRSFMARRFPRLIFLLLLCPIPFIASIEADSRKPKRFKLKRFGFYSFLLSFRSTFRGARTGDEASAARAERSA